MTITNRLKKLEQLDHSQVHKGYKHILRLIKKGAYYDELTEEQKDDYWAYHNTSREVWEGIQEEICHLKHEPMDWHFQLERRPKPPTPEEVQRNQKEVARIVEQFVKEYRREQKAREENGRNQQINEDWERSNYGTVKG